MAATVDLGPQVIDTVGDIEKICVAQDNTKNFFVTSVIPEKCKEEPCILGIDEAGRGPVLGPMVYGICYCVKSDEEVLKETGCADSKTLSEENREKILEDLCTRKESVGWEITAFSPVYISNCMLKRQKVSLNEISHNGAIELVKRAIDAGVNVTEIFVDTVGPAEKYQAKLKEVFPQLEVTVKSKADSLFPVVSAASIFAKVTRDVCLRVWKFPELPSQSDDLNWGSGYPNDPETKKFLVNNMDPVFGFPQLVRFSWSTADKILEEHAVPVEWEEVDQPKKPPSVKKFFKKTDAPVEDSMHRFFAERNLKPAVRL